MMEYRPLVIIGGGSAGMSAALSAYKKGVKDILVLERDKELGGILNQCIHNGFGLQVYQEELSGPAFAYRLRKELMDAAIPYHLHTTVLSIRPDLRITYASEEAGYVQIQASAIILACGCFERNRGAISIPGKRIKGIYTAGSAQRYLNMENILVGKRVFILGSGDIGLIMARRMTLEGAQVVGVAELMPYSNGLTRNIVQCLDDFDIPLFLSHTITNIEGDETLQSITIQKVDEDRKPIKGTKQTFDVDTLLLSVGLIPENSLAEDAGVRIDPRTKGAVVNEHLETSVPHIYACGNALHVHDLVDFVVKEAQMAGEYAAIDILKDRSREACYKVVHREGVSYVVPQILHTNIQEDKTVLSFRVNRPYKQSLIEFYDDQENRIKTVKKQFLLPAEMVRVSLNQRELSSVKGNLNVRVVAL